MKNRKLIYLAAGLFIIAVFCIPSYCDMVSYVWKASTRMTVVLDPGHGGMDGGAQSSDGISEKDINLKISASLKKMLEDRDIRVIMTRDDDHGLYDKSCEGTIRSLKTCDMHKRKQIIDEADPHLAVSIHLNSFTQDTSVCGAQVFYPSQGDPEIINSSKIAAEIIQTDLNKNINKVKQRDVLGKNDVYLFQNVAVPIVIVECGFLSNRDEAIDLKKKAYQEKIAKSLESSIFNYLSKNGNKTQ